MCDASGDALCGEKDMPCETRQSGHHNSVNIGDTCESFQIKKSNLLRQEKKLIDNGENISTVIPEQSVDNNYSLMENGQKESKSNSKNGFHDKKKILKDVEQSDSSDIPPLRTTVDAKELSSDSSSTTELPGGNFSTSVTNCSENHIKANICKKCGASNPTSKISHDISEKEDSQSLTVASGAETDTTSKISSGKGTSVDVSHHNIPNSSGTANTTTQKPKQYKFVKSPETCAGSCSTDFYTNLYSQKGAGTTAAPAPKSECSNTSLVAVDKAVKGDKNNSGAANTTHDNGAENKRCICALKAELKAPPVTTNDGTQQRFRSHSAKELSEIMIHNEALCCEPGYGKAKLPPRHERIKRGLATYIQHMPAYRPLVICGPSGSGKSTLLKRLLKDYGDFFALSVSHTTRKPRPGEVNGKDYHFVTRAEMEDAIAHGDFIEYTEFSGNIYGTSKKAVRDVQNHRRICILDIEIEGVKNIRNTDLNPHLVFIKPPSLQVLEERLRSRGTETEESLRKRLERAVEEIRYGETPGMFDIVIENDCLKTAYSKLHDYIVKELAAEDTRPVAEV